MKTKGTGEKQWVQSRNRDGPRPRETPLGLIRVPLQEAKAETMKAIPKWNWQTENGIGVVALGRRRKRSSSCQRMRYPKEKNMRVYVGSRPKRKLASIGTAVGTSGQMLEAWVWHLEEARRLA